MGFESAQQVFELVINKSYLAHLSEEEHYHVLALDSKKEIKDLRWVKIDKIVLEKSVFTPDQLSMVYSAMHTMARTLAVLLKKENGHFSLYYGVRDYHDKDKHESLVTLKYALQGFFPGIELKEVDNDISIYPESKNDGPESETDTKPENPQYDVSAVSGVGALKDDRKQAFLQGLEKLIEGARTINSFSILFLAERVDSEATRNVIDSYGQISSALLPLSQRQIALNQTYSEGITHTLTKSFTESVTKNIGTTSTYGVNLGEFESDVNTVGGNVGGGVKAGDSGEASLGLNYGHSWVKGDSEVYTKSWGFQESEATSSQEGTAEANAEMKTWAEGITHQFTIQERSIKLYLDLIDKQINRLGSSIPYGLWNMASYCIVENSEERSKSLAAIFKGAMVGDDSDVDTVRVNHWHNEVAIRGYLEKCLHPRFQLQDKSAQDQQVVVTPASIVNSKELSIMMPLPQCSVPGIVVRGQASFGRNVDSNYLPNSTVECSLEMGHLAHLGQVNEVRVNLNVPLLASHTFVTGTTGSGKTNAVFHLLSHLPKSVGLLVIEPAKGEYKHVLTQNFKKTGGEDGVANETDDRVNVYGTNPNYSQLLKINPFSFFEGIHVYEHIESIVQIFNACWPMYAAMPVVLKRSIEEAYRLSGWDLLESMPTCPGLYPTIKDVVSCMNRILDESQYSSDTKSDYRGALETRLLALSEGLLGEMFSGPSFVDESDLFDGRAIVDLSRLDNPETKALLMGLLVLKLKERRMCCGKVNSEGLKHITVLEEAHHLLRKTSLTQNQEGANIAGKAVEMLVNGIAEMRSFGEGFVIVDQTPSLLDPSVIRNTNTKIVLNLPDYEDRLIVGKSIGLNDDQIIEIGRQKCGYAVINQSFWEEPVQCRIDEFGYKKDYRYQYTPIKGGKGINKTGSQVDQEVLSFLLNKRLRDRPSFQVDRIKESVLSSDMSTSFKYRIVTLVDEYMGLPEPRKDDLSLWQISNFDQLSRLVSEYVGLDDDFKDAIRRDCNPLSFDLQVNRIVEMKIPGVSSSMRLNIQHCVLRSLKKNKDELDRFKAWYLRNKK